MKDKALYLIIGLLIGAILTTGIFMLINKNGSNSNFQSNNSRNGGPTYIGDRQPPTQEELDAMEKTILEDGSIQYQSTDGGMMIKKSIGPGSGDAANR